MQSKWYESKPKALELRQKGTSLREVEKILHIPKSTLSGWFRSIKLSEKQKLILKVNQLKHLQKARKQAIKWHNLQREIRLKNAEEEAEKVLSKLDHNNKVIQELALAMLYLGEGSKNKSGTVMRNSDPLILKFFINSIIKNYDINIKKIKCSLHLRSDQNPELLKQYWSKELNIPLENFNSPSIDHRTTGRPTYPNYNGVCVIYCGNIALQRKLVFLSRKFCEKIITKNLRAVSSAG